MGFDAFLHTLFGRTGVPVLLLIAAVLTVACDKAQLLAPTKSTISVSAPTSVLPSGGSTEVTAVVTENSGSPVQNGTTVRFTATLGRVDPVEAQTRNGLAVTTFFADNSSGIAKILATSGLATGGGTATAAGTNVVEITIGAAAVNTVSIRANPGSVGPGGGSVELIATVVGENGQTLPGIVVTFNADQGSLSASTATTSAGGDARTTLTTSQQTVASATAGTKTSSNVTVTVRAGPIVTITCTTAVGTCPAVQASTSNNTATVNFAVAKATGSSALRTATIDFGDGTSQGLGNLIAATTVTHTYSGPSSPGTQSYTAIVSATDVNDESASISTPVIVTRAVRPQLIVTLSATVGTVVAGRGVPVSFIATVTPATDGADVVSKYEWTFEVGASTVETNGNATTHVYTDNGVKTASVKVTTTDGRTATARAEFIINGL